LFPDGAEPGVVAYRDIATIITVRRGVVSTAEVPAPAVEDVRSVVDTSEIPLDGSLSPGPCDSIPL